MARHLHRVPMRLELHQQLGVARRDVVHLHHVGPRHQLLQLRHRQPGQLLQFPFGQTLLLVGRAFLEDSGDGVTYGHGVDKILFITQE